MVESNNSRCNLIVKNLLFSMDDNKENNNRKSTEISGKKYKKTKEENASLFSILTFGWLSKLFYTGYKRPLEMKDLDYLIGTDHAHESVKLFYSAWRQQLKKAKEKNAKYNAKHGIQQEQKENINVNVIDREAPLLQRQESDQSSAPKHEKLDEDAKYHPSIVMKLTKYS